MSQAQLSSNAGFRSFGPQLRPMFVEQLSSAAATLGIRLTWHSDFWVARLTKGAVTKHVIGYTFPLNDAAAAQVTSDKAAAYALLRSTNLPAVPHRLLRFHGMEPAEWTSAVLDGMSLPVVAKPHTGSGGVDVYRAATYEELDKTLTLLAERYRAITVSPFLNVDDEYRAVVLDREVKLIYRKVRNTETKDGQVGEWRHNLRLGAYPELLDAGVAHDGLSALAIKATDALGLTFASVDIVTTGRQLQILELNSAVTLEHFSQHSPQYAEMALAIYETALRLSFKA